MVLPKGEVRDDVEEEKTRDSLVTEGERATNIETGEPD